MRTTASREVRITRLSLALTVLLVTVLMRHLGRVGATAYTEHHVRLTLEAAACAASVLCLIYGNLLYQWCRLGFYRRRQVHVAASRDVLERIYDDRAPSLAILIPSYKEEPRVVWQTLLSAAFTEYPDKSIVLLIDDPPEPRNPEDRQKLTEVRDLAPRLNESFRAAADHFAVEWTAFLKRGSLDHAAETGRLAQLYDEAAKWVESLAHEWRNDASPTGSPHADAFFVRAVVEALVAQHIASAEALRQRLDAGDFPDQAGIARQYRRLAELFHVRFSTFERKQYTNLSHDANKAMNLNSYIGLMEKGWRAVGSRDRRRLEQVTVCRDGDLVVPAADYLIALDADSVLLPDYALRLVHIMEQPEHARIAIVQTPYSAFPGASSPLERIAGATTDLQYIVHQGFSDCDATFWVGANALIRRRALDDIKETRVINGSAVSVYIQDRTLIEDTESSIDLVHVGWKLYNYPDRLAYSATPADFGSLLIQRRRWANGGLLILPKLLRNAAAGPKNLSAFKELIARFHYLFSLAGSSAALLLLFFYPFDDGLATIWMPLSTLPYVVLYARDLRIAGYRYVDALRVYALNLALVPVVIGGVLKSLQQALTGVKLPFARTPKVMARSAAPAMYCVLELALPVGFLAAGAWDFEMQRRMLAAFSFLNAAFLGYALVALLGVDNTITDLVAGFRSPSEPLRGERALDLTLRAPRRLATTTAVGEDAHEFNVATDELVGVE